MNEKIGLKYYDTLGPIIFVCILEESKTAKNHFEINWPLPKYLGKIRAHLLFKHMYESGRFG